MKYNQITVGIVTFKSEKVIFNCLKNIKEFRNILILDNSNDKSLKKRIQIKYPKVNIILSKKNLGYGVANNIIIKKSKTPYVFILSPDVILKKNCEKSLLNSIRKLKNNFSLLSPISQVENYGFFEKNIKQKKKLFEVDYVNGFAILINKIRLKKVGMFDENIFLYNEEIDLCKRLKIQKEKIYIDANARVKHLGAKSTNLGFEFDKCRNWHWMWSQVYFAKKYNNHFYVILKFVGLMFLISIKIIFYAIFFNKKKNILNMFRLSGIFNSLIGKSSWYRPNLT